jgi:hypothetical protein
VVVHGSITRSVQSRAQQDFQRLLRTPSGCFEQFTSINLVNLSILSAVRDRIENIAAVERAILHAREAYQRLLKHSTQAGGFSLFPGKNAETHPSIVAVRQLALYDSIFPGLGKAKLEAVIAWFEIRKLDRQQTLQLTMILHNLDRRWKGSSSILKWNPKTRYEAAVLANCIAQWPGEWPASYKQTREELLSQAFAATGEHSAGQGFMGSIGRVLDVQILALVATALHEAGREDEAHFAVRQLARQSQLGYGQTAALCIRALGLFETDAPEVEEPLPVRFASNPGGVERGTSVAEQPTRFEFPVAAEPGSTVKLALNYESTIPCSTRLACTYRIATPKRNLDAPFEITARMTPTAIKEEAMTLRVSIEPRKSYLSSQVVTCVGLPGGATVDEPQLRGYLDGSDISFWEIRDGYLDLYWNGTIQNPKHLDIPLRATSTGRFRTPPSIVFPYYESGRAAYSKSIELKVFDNRDSNLEIERRRQQTRISF